MSRILILLSISMILNIRSDESSNEKISDYFIGVPIQIFLSFQNNQHIAKRTNKSEENPFLIVNKYLAADKHGYDDRIEINKNEDKYEITVGGSQLCASSRDLVVCDDKNDNSLWDIKPDDVSFVIAHKKNCITSTEEGLKLIKCDYDMNQKFNFKRLSKSKQCLKDDEKDKKLENLDSVINGRSNNLFEENEENSEEHVDAYSSDTSLKDSEDVCCLCNEDGTVKLGNDNPECVSICQLASKEHKDNIENLPTQKLVMPEKKNNDEKETPQKMDLILKPLIDEKDNQLKPSLSDNDKVNTPIIDKKEAEERMTPEERNNRFKKLPINYKNKYGQVSHFSNEQTAVPQDIRSTLDPEKSITNKKIEDILKAL